MIRTNKHGLPEALVDALIGDDFDLNKTPKNVFWGTRLLTPPKVATLERRHWDELEADVADGKARVMGSALHDRVNHYQKGHRLSEEKFYVRVSDMSVYTLPVGGRLIDQPWYNEDEIYVSLKLDCYTQVDDYQGIVEDYKYTSIYAVTIENKPKDEWVEQNNMYGYVLRKIGFPVTELRNILVLDGWMKSEAKRNPAYPQIPFHVFGNQPIWSDEMVEEFIRKKIWDHQKSMELDDDDIPHCSEKERWAKPPSWAVMKVGMQKAVRVLYSVEEADARCAQEQAGNPKAKYEVVFRPGANVRCVDYCSVKHLCHFGRTIEK